MRRRRCYCRSLRQLPPPATAAAQPLGFPAASRAFTESIPSIPTCSRPFPPRPHRSNADVEVVLTELADPNARPKRETVEPGDNVRHMLCARANSVEELFSEVGCVSLTAGTVPFVQ